MNPHARERHTADNPESLGPAVKTRKLKRHQHQRTMICPCNRIMVFPDYGKFHPLSFHELNTLR